MASRDLEPTMTLHSRRPDRAGRSPSARMSVLCAVVVATALVTATAAQSKPIQRLESPQLAEISRASTPIVDRQITTAKVSAVARGGLRIADRYLSDDRRSVPGRQRRVRRRNAAGPDQGAGGERGRQGDGGSTEGSHGLHSTSVP